MERYRRQLPALLLPHSVPRPWLRRLVSALRLPLELSHFGLPHQPLAVVAKPPGIRRRVCVSGLPADG